MRQIRFSKRHRPAAELDPLPLDPRDPDMVRAKELARRQSRTGEQPGLRRGLAAAFGFAIAACLIAALAPRYCAAAGMSTANRPVPPDRPARAPQLIRPRLHSAADGAEASQPASTPSASSGESARRCRRALGMVPLQSRRAVDGTS